MIINDYYVCCFPDAVIMLKNASLMNTGKISPFLNNHCYHHLTSGVKYVPEYKLRTFENNAKAREVTNNFVIDLKC